MKNIKNVVKEVKLKMLEELDYYKKDLIEQGREDDMEYVLKLIKEAKEIEDLEVINSYFMEILEMDRVAINY